MTGGEFRKLATSFEGAVEQSHMGHPDFRVAGKIFATLGPDEDWAMVWLKQEDQASFIAAQPDVFSPASGAWGMQGATIIQLKAAKRSVVKEALEMAFQHRLPPAPKRKKQ
jgi:Protein of unknown function (DUF419).